MADPHFTMHSLFRVLNCLKRYNLALLYHRKGQFLILLLYVVSLCFLQPSFRGLGDDDAALLDDAFVNQHAVVVISMGQQAQESQA